MKPAIAYAAPRAAGSGNGERRRHGVLLATGGAASASGASSYAAARVARIMLRREPGAEEALAWASITARQSSAARGRAELAIALLDTPELVKLEMRERIARAYDAVLDRYDAGLPRDIVHWEQLHADGTLSLEELIRVHFMLIFESGFRYDPCMAPVDARRPFFVVRDGHGLPLVFAVGANSRLYLFRHTVFGGWSQTDLSAALPQPARNRVQCIDVRQGADGRIAVALSVAVERRGMPHSTLYVTTGLSNGLGEADWVEAFRTMQQRRGLPDGAVATQIAFGPLLAGAVPLVLLTAVVDEVTDTWYFNAAAPASPMNLLRLPADVGQVRSYAIGSYRLPGVWTLAAGGPEPLRFTSFPEQFGAPVHVSYKGLPSRPSSFLLAQGAIPNVPDVYVAGEGIVVYRGGHDVPQAVIQVAGARLVWSERDAGGEHLAYTDRAGGLWLVSRAVGCAWQQPRAIAERLVATALCADPARVGVHALGVTPGGALEWQRIGAQGAMMGVEVTQTAVWEEVPLDMVQEDGDVVPRMDTAA